MIRKYILIIVALTITPTFVFGAELNDLSNKYLQAFKEKKFKMAASYLHCPEIYSTEERAKDLKALTKALNIYYEEFNAIESWKLTDNNLYIIAMTACGNIPYWEANPPVKQMVYSTIHKNGKQGYIVLNFSKINGKFVLAFANHGIPKLGSSSVDKMKKVYQRIAKEVI